MKRPNRRGRRIPVFLVLPIVLAACGGASSTGNPTQPPPVTTTTPSLASVTLNPASVTGGQPSQGTVTLSAAAPAAGATVTLTSSNGAVASVPGTVTIGSGSTSGPFTVTTQAVTAATPVTITGSMSGGTQTAALTVTPPAPPPLVARFTVISAERGADACMIIRDGAELDCEFNARSSTGTIVRYRWEYLVGTSRDDQDTTEPILRPRAGCGFLGGQQDTRADGTRFIQMEVRLRVEGPGGVLSAESRNANVRLFPNGNCYGF